MVNIIRTMRPKMTERHGARGQMNVGDGHVVWGNEQNDYERLVVSLKPLANEILPHPMQRDLRFHDLGETVVFAPRMHHRPHVSSLPNNESKPQNEELS